jgi:hypothetical protein
VPFAVGEKNSADGVAGDCLFFDYMRLAVRALTHNQCGIIGHRDRTQNKSDETRHSQGDSCFHNTLLFLPGSYALAVWGLNASFFRARGKNCGWGKLPARTTIKMIGNRKIQKWLG